MDKYLVWRADGGWFSTTATGTTLIADAQRFSREDAILFCKNRLYTGEFRYIPVSLSDIEEVTKK